MLLVAGCARSELDFTPPHRTQMACAHEGDSQRPMILIVDTGSSEVIWANGEGTPRGSLHVTKYSYALEFRSRSGALVSSARINRFDGRMEREVGQAPFFAPGHPRPGNHRQSLLCEQQVLKQKV
ncbi:hypothetical protein [Stenotrophomonas sp. 22385]|uniref:hypothetical protein n=1 Tax=Stenotrophomonas sp. 22385 TaxID=3453915 RepID=UPI003F87DA9D